MAAAHRGGEGGKMEYQRQGTEEYQYGLYLKYSQKDTRRKMRCHASVNPNLWNLWSGEENLTPWWEAGMTDTDDGIP